MILNTSIKVKNYKCFDENEQGFEKIYPLNILIGKNNSGKSSLIDLVEFCFNPKPEASNSNKIDIKECTIQFQPDPDIVKSVATEYAQKTNISNSAYWIREINTLLNQFAPSDFGKLSKNQDSLPLLITKSKIYGKYENDFQKYFTNFFQRKNFRRINADRDILKESFNNGKFLYKNGRNATAIIWKYLSIRGYDLNLIKEKLLNCLNEIAKPDIAFSDISIKEDPEENRMHALGEIYFKQQAGSWVGLSQMGSGIKTILLVLLNLIVIPEMEELKKEDLIFGFEELENNLHPSLQRRLFNYISTYAEENESHFFITTHSNIVIDLFSNNPNAQLIHVENKGKNSIAKTIKTHFDKKTALKDLDFKASDLLLSNGIIWVEGPSDAIYIELLLDLYKQENQKFSTYNYCIQSLSTAIWKYSGFTDFDWGKINSEELSNRIISLAKLNHNHLIVLDKDDNFENKKPSEWKSFKNGTGQNKARLIHESMLFANHDETNLNYYSGDSNDNKLFYWITDGTFESYLEYFIENKGSKFTSYFSKNKKSKFFEKKRSGTNSSKSKVILAAEIAQFVAANNFSLYDLAPKGSELLNKVIRLIETIKSWNIY